MALCAGVQTGLLMSNKKPLLATLSVIAIIAAFPLIALAWRGLISPVPRSILELGLTTPLTGVPPLAAQERRDLMALVFEVRPSGFMPDEVDVSSGRYLIVLHNRTGRRDLTFRLDRENGERLREVRQQQLDWKGQFDLQPGNYILSELEHPEWRCVIRVTPR